MGFKHAIVYVGLVLMCGCASEPTSVRNEEVTSCPPNEVLVCRGGTVSRIGNADRRNPQTCSCQPGN